MRLLYQDGKRLSDYLLKAQLPVVGWLFYEPADYAGRAGMRARLAPERGGGEDVLWLDHAKVRECKGAKGLLLVGVQFRSRGRKHSYSDTQAWWCQAPPIREPLIDVNEMERIAWGRRQREVALRLGLGLDPDLP